MEAKIVILVFLRIFLAKIEQSIFETEESVTFGRTSPFGGPGMVISKVILCLFHVRTFKVGCAFPMVVVSLLSHVEIGRNDDWEYAPHFRKSYLDRIARFLFLNRFFDFNLWFGLFGKVRIFWYYFGVKWGFNKNRFSRWRVNARVYYGLAWRLIWLILQL